MNIQLAERIQHAVAVIYPDIQQSAGAQRQVPTEENVWYEFSCCVLSSQVPFSLAQAAADKIDESGVLSSRDSRSRSDIEQDLSTILHGTFSVDGKVRRYRFPAAKSAQLAAAKSNIASRFGSLIEALMHYSDVEDTRRWLVQHAPGLGPKQASMFLRNLGVSDEMAILDRHILSYMSLTGLCHESRTSISNYKSYKSYEIVLRDHAKSLGYTLGLFDWALWVVMRVLADVSRDEGQTA
jgi:N-glycosylase/DNA lyase